MNYGIYIYIKIHFLEKCLIDLYIYVSGENLSHQLSTCSAVSLPSKIDNIGSDDDLGDADDPEYEINDEDEDDYDDGFTAYDDEEYNSEGDSRSRSAGGVLDDGVEHSYIYSNGRKSPNRKLGQRYAISIFHLLYNEYLNQT